jgi:hypothetical protein
LCVPKPSKWLFTIADQYGDGAYDMYIWCIKAM